MQTMNPKTSIPPTDLVRRRGQRRKHIVDLGRSHPDLATITFCGQTIRNPMFSTAYNAQDVGCDKCLIEAIGRKAGGANR